VHFSKIKGEKQGCKMEQRVEGSRIERDMRKENGTPEKSGKAEYFTWNLRRKAQLEDT
jgi:hypothetical protein